MLHKPSVRTSQSQAQLELEVLFETFLTTETYNTQLRTAIGHSHMAGLDVTVGVSRAPPLF